MREIDFDAPAMQKADPLALFADWLAAAKRHEQDATAMTLATIDSKGAPDARIVLLKKCDAQGFVFYTNTESQKAQAMASDARIALCFHWQSLARQVRVQGQVVLVETAEADAYFASRPHDSKLGAWASQQSRPLDSRATLEADMESARARFADGDVPRPPHWSGYRLAPTRIEFWQAGAHRLHDRLAFTRTTTQSPWACARLYP